MSDKRAVIFTTTKLSNIPFHSPVSINQATNGNMATSCPPGLDLTDVDSTALPQNLRTTDPLITALVNYKIGVETLFANFAEMETNLGSVGFHNVSLTGFETIEGQLR